MTRLHRPFAGVSIPVTALVLILGTAACGDSDDEPEQGSSASGGAASTDGGSGSGAGAREGGDGGGQGPGGEQAGDGGGQGGDGGGPGATADGDDRSSSGERARRRARARRQTRVIRTAKAVVAGIYQALRVSDVGRVCDSMTAAARRATAKIGPGPGMSCEEVLGNYYAYAERDNPKFRQSLRARVLGAEVDGDRASVTVRFPSGRRRAVELVLVDGRWRLPAAGRL